MSIKTDAELIRDETITGANTAARVGGNLVDIADDLVAKQTLIDANTAKTGITAQQATDITTNNAKNTYPSADASKLAGIEAGAKDDQTGSEIKALYEAEVNTNAFTDAEKTKLSNIESSATADQTDTEIETAYNNRVGVVSQVDAEAGTSTTVERWTPERVKQAIVALGGSGSVDDTAYGVSWNGVTTTAPSKNALYDFIESQVFKVDTNSNIIPVFWGGTQAEYDIDFPSGHPNNYFVVITDGALTPLEAAEISIEDAGALITATDVEGALQENRTAIDLNTAKNTYPSGDATKVGYLTVTQAVDLDTMESNIATNNSKVGVTTEISNLSEDTTPQLGGELDFNGNSVGGDAQAATGDGATTIDWKLGNFFHFQFGAFNETFTFTAPTKAGTFILKLVQDSVGSRTATFPATVKWSGGTAPTLTTTATTGTDIITFYFDGTNYFAVEVLDFS